MKGVKYDLTSDLIFLRPLIKVIYIYVCKDIFYFTCMELKLIYQGMWVARYRAIWFAERRVVGSQSPGNFLLASVFCWNWKNIFTTHSRIANKIANNSYPPSQTTASMLTQLEREGRRKGWEIQRSGWGLLSHWRSDRSMRRSGRVKAEG